MSKPLLTILAIGTLALLGGCTEEVQICNRGLYTVCYIDIKGQSGDAMTNCENTGAYIGKVCTYGGECISDGINDDRR